LTHPEEEDEDKGEADSSDVAVLPSLFPWTLFTLFENDTAAVDVATTFPGTSSAVGVLPLSVITTF